MDGINEQYTKPPNNVVWTFTLDHHVEQPLFNVDTTLLISTLK